MLLRDAVFYADSDESDGGDQPGKKAKRNLFNHVEEKLTNLKSQYKRFQEETNAALK